MVSSTGSQAGTRPVAAHPLFTALVSLWCGALLGLGTLAAHPAALAAGLGQLKIASVVPADASVILSSQNALAATLAAIGCIAGLSAARLAKRLTMAGKHKPYQDVLVMAEVPALSSSAVQGLRDPQVVREDTPEPASDVTLYAEAATTRQRSVLDISAIDLAGADANEVLDLAALANERQGESVPPVDAVPARSHEDTEQALRDALAVLRKLRGAA